MIKTQVEYAQAVELLSKFQERLDAKRQELKDLGLTKEQIAKLTEPEIVFHGQTAEEVASYDRLRRGDQSELTRYQEFSELGKLLVALRIFRGMSQQDLAKALGVDPSQVSRDERNEYHGITVPRVNKILAALGVRLSSTPTGFVDPSREPEYA